MARNGVGSIWDGLDSIDLIDLCGMKQNVLLGISTALIPVYTCVDLLKLCETALAQFGILRTQKDCVEWDRIPLRDFLCACF